MKVIFQIIVFAICAAALFSAGYFWGSGDIDKTLLKQITQLVNDKSSIELPSTTTIISTDINTVDLIKTLESLKGIDSWSLSQSHYFWGYGEKWNPNFRDLILDFKNNERYSFTDKTPDQLMALVQVLKRQHE